MGEDADTPSDTPLICTTPRRHKPRYSHLWRLSRPCSGVAKIDRFNSRATALAEDGPLDEFYRPAGATSRPRSNRAENPLPVGAPDLRDEDDRDQEPFLRSRRRVAVRQSILPRTRIGRVALACG